jgi:hypothetical protein
MYGETKSGMQCQEFDALLAEALDGALTGADLERFQAHKAACPNCGPLFADANTGMRWLAGLQEVEPPANLVHNILAATIGRMPETPEVRPAENWWHRVRAWMQPVFTPVLQPRFAMSFGMAFFSLSLILNLAGVKLADIRHVDLRPSAVVRGFYETQGKLVKYYENIRVVYEIESRVQQIKRATTPEETTPAPQQKDRKDQSGEPKKQYQNYSREENPAVMARLFEIGDLGSDARRMS